MPYVAGQRDLCGVVKYVMPTLFLNFVVFINCLSDTVYAGGAADRHRKVMINITMIRIACRRRHLRRGTNGVCSRFEKRHQRHNCGSDWYV